MRQHTPFKTFSSVETVSGHCKKGSLKISPLVRRIVVCANCCKIKFGRRRQTLQNQVWRPSRLLWICMELEQEAGVIRKINCQIAELLKILRETLRINAPCSISINETTYFSRLLRNANLRFQ